MGTSRVLGGLTHLFDFCPPFLAVCTPPVKVLFCPPILMKQYVKKAVTTENVVVSFGGIFYVLNSSVHLQPRLQNRDN